ncbi:MAG: DUF6484 domain-containing protein [Candidatus Methylumidiphilus sp.]
MNKTNLINHGEVSPLIRIDGVVIGVLAGFDGEQRPLVVYPGNPNEEAIAARASTRLTAEDIGREIALLFENGDPSCPLIIGRVRHPEEMELHPESLPRSVQVDGERMLIEAKEEIVLRCGKASITLTKAGKVIIRGAYVLSRSSGVNRVKGGSVQIN